MTTTFSPTSPQFHTNHWDKSLPNRSDESDQGAMIYRDRSRSKKSYRQLQVRDERPSPDQTFSDAQQSWNSSSSQSSPLTNIHTDRDESPWIHRDKLAQIETREMQQAGITLRMNSPMVSRNSPDGFGYYQPVNTLRPTPQQSGYESQSSAIYSQEDSEGVVETHGFGFEDRKAQKVTNSARRPSAGSPGASRIPVSRTSPTPLPGSPLDRGSPTEGSGQGSATSSPTNMTRMQRPRSQSLGSDSAHQSSIVNARRTSTGRPLSAHMDGSTLSSGSAGSTGQSPKPRMLNSAKGHAAKAGQPRKTSITKQTIAPKDSPARSVRSRPTSMHRPEGEAPWIATMYKPDPMLPPDQQMLPTHAKRMMQEQWAREGKTGDTYDRNFNLLNTNDLSNKARDESPSPAEISRPATAANDQPPLSQQNAPAETVEVKRSSSSAGGYRITPTISQTGTPPRRQSAYRLQTAQRLPNEEKVAQRINPEIPELPGNEPMAVHRLDPEKLAAAQQQKRKNAGCGCCIVM